MVKMRRIFINLLKSSLWLMQKEKLLEFNRFVPVGDLLFGRQEVAQFMNFGEGSTCYSNCLIIGDVSVGRNCWIGPNTILDGSGGLFIGDDVTVSAGVQIYSHLSHSSAKQKKQETYIGNKVYIGPNSVIQMGVRIEDGATIGALTFVNRNLKKGERMLGNLRIIPE